jgi:soluble lytic murein transglycosylase-like protein
MLFLACVLAIQVAAPSQAEDRPASAGRYAAFIAEAAPRFNIPAHRIRNVMRVESADDSRAVSHAGAMALMEIMPATWNELRARCRLGSDAFDPRDIILAGAAYLRELYDRYGSPGFLAACNAGPERHRQYLVDGRPPAPRDSHLHRETAAADRIGGS